MPRTWSVHVFFSDLLAMVRDAHRVGDVDVLDRAYRFADWCLWQPGQFLAHAAVISFYEHLFDDWELRHAVVDWLPKAVITKVRPLWEWRLTAPRLAEVDRLLANADPATA
ncbi:MAG: hypothetical protein J2O49_10345 [Sciscionella sp.]|nr:hypothetical protein [Sciscionella sp.]